MSTELKYGLRLKSKEWLLGIEVTSNGENRTACGEHTYRLDEWAKKPWLLEDYNKVLMAKWASEEWYNSDYENPVNPYNPLELEVVKVLTITVPKETDLSDEIDAVNEMLAQQGYALLDKTDYLDEGEEKHGDTLSDDE